MPFIKVSNEKASAIISIYGGQVLSYKPVDEPEDLLFISDNAYFQEGKAIKGGVPICWPWFGADQTSNENPNHGFVRNNFWAVSSVENLANGNTKIILEFTDTNETRKICSYHFFLSLEIIIGSDLTLKLTTFNRGSKPFSITEALHAYFNISYASQIQVLGLEKTEYLDKTENFVKACQVGAVTLAEETDRIHEGNKQNLTINDPGFNRKIKITSSGNKNIVVWNPWIHGASDLADLGNDDYKHFICVEIANVASNIVKILAGGDHILNTNYSIIRD